MLELQATRGERHPISQQALGTHSQQLADGIWLCLSHVTVARPNNSPLAAGDGVRVFAAFYLAGNHTPLIGRTRGQGLLSEVVPLSEVGHVSGGPDHRLNKEQGE